MEIKRWYIGIGNFWLPTPFFDIEEDEDDTKQENISYSRCEGIWPAELFTKEQNDTTND